MHKRIILSLLLVLALLLAACSAKAPEVAPKPDAEQAEEEAKETPTEPAEDLRLDFVYMATWGGKDAPIVKDQIEKAGIKVNLVQVPDYAAYKERVNSGNFDIAFSGWNTVTGNPDYAVRSLFVAGEDYNTSGLDDEEISRLILEAGTQTPDQYVKTYHDFEKLLTEKSYIVPLYNILKTQAFNTDVLLDDTSKVRLSKSRASDYAAMEFVNKDDEKTKPLLLTQHTGDMTSLDPVKANDGSINSINTNMYTRLVNLSDDDEVTPVGSLSHEFAIADGNKAYYFLLRDDLNFATLKDGKAVDTKERVGADDVVFSMNRAKDKDAVPEHRTYTLHGHMDTISVVTDLDELEAVKLKDGSSVLEHFNAAVKTPVNELVDDKKKAKNSKGSYQVVRIDTKEAFPQVLNFLAHQSAGILSAKQVSKVNEAGVYGDQNEAVKDGHIYASGPYLLSGKTDQKISMVKNPFFMPGTENEAHIENVDILIIPDSNAAVQALLSGELHVLYTVPPLHHTKVENSEHLRLVERSSNSCNFIIFNLKDEYQRPVRHQALREAVSYAIDPAAFIQIVQSGKAVEIASSVTPLIRDLPGYEAVHKITDLEKAKEALAAYQEATK